MNCWHCGSGMQGQTIREVSYNVCNSCGSLAVPIMRSLALWRELENADVEEPEGATGGDGTRCGQCSGEAETFGYQYSKVMVQRCSPCRVLFVPGDRQREVRNVWRKANHREMKQIKARSEALGREMRDKPIRRMAPRYGGRHQHRRLDPLYVMRLNRFNENEAARAFEELKRSTEED